MEFLPRVVGIFASRTIHGNAPAVSTALLNPRNGKTVELKGCDEIEKGCSNVFAIETPGGGYGKPHELRAPQWRRQPAKVRPQAYRVHRL